MRTKGLSSVLSIILVVVLIITIISNVVDLVQYYLTLGKTFDHIKILYHIYALAFIIKSILFSMILLFTLKLMENVDQGFYFSDKNYKLIIRIAASLVFYNIPYILTGLIVYEPKYVDILSINGMNRNLILLMGIAMLSFASIYRSSQNIKEENDLTI
ncbi:DUF2975 domain-containing protein [Staphylococcus sp. 11261D007BR]